MTTIRKPARTLGRISPVPVVVTLSRPPQPLRSDYRCALSL